MTWDPNAYVKLLLRREEGKRDKWLIALRTTADYYGWSEEFPIWTPKPVVQTAAYTYVSDPGRKGRMFWEGGRQHRICRSPKKAGFPRGLTNQFKLSSNCGLVDIAEVAEFTKVEWYWMDCPYGERLDRDVWLSIYREDRHVRSGGLVSV